MVKTRIVRGQAVSSIKFQKSRQLRRRMTAAERWFWRNVRGREPGGLVFRRQQVIEGFIVDFFCAPLGLVVEIDGGVHSEQREYDRERDELLAAMGLRVLRFDNDLVLDRIDEVLEQIRAAAHRPNL